VIAAGGKEGKTVKVIDVTTYEELSSVDLDGRIGAISPDGKTVAVRMRGHPELSVQLFDLAAGKAGQGFKGLATGKGTSDRIGITADGKALAACGAQQIKVWDTVTGKEKFTL